MPPRGRRFVRELDADHLGVLEAEQATELSLDAIARSDGSRGSVLRKLRRAHVRNGPLGTFHFDRSGDMTPMTMNIIRLTGATTRGTPAPDIPGAVFDRAISLREPHTSSATSTISRSLSHCCSGERSLPRAWRRSRTGATGRAGRDRRTAPPPRSAA